MKKITLIISVLLIAFMAHAGDEQAASILFGNGRASEGGNMQWRTFEVRIGSSIAPNTRLDLVHYNEGHPDNNHRDGFALQPIYNISIYKNIKLEVGVGPYFSFNTTTRDKTQYDDKNLGILGSAVVLYYLNTLREQNLHLRIDYNHVGMFEEHSSNAILVGVGINFGKDAASTSAEESLDSPTEISVMGSNFKTNRNATEANFGGVIEIRQYDGKNFAVSLSWIQEGDDVLVDRNGAAAQVWYVWPISKYWALSAGAGPYLAQNSLNSNKTELEGLINIELEQHIGKPENGTSLLFRFGRIVTDDDTDRDIFSLGVAQKF